MNSIKTCFRINAHIRQSALMFLFIFIVGLMYSFTQPIFGVSDEPAHVVKAVASGRGEFMGPKVIGQFGYSATEYDVPAAYDSIWNFVCYNGDVNVTPKCSQKLTTDRKLVPVSTTAGNYPPLYYVAVGWIGNTIVGPSGIYLMRIATSFIVAVLLAFSFMQSLRFLSNAKAITASLIAFTPTVAAFAGTVNPFSVEVAAATLFWTTSISIFIRQEEKKFFRSDCLLFISGVLLALIRPVSFLWIAIIELFLLCFFYELSGAKRKSNRKTTQLAIAATIFIISIGVNFSRSGVTGFGASGPAGGSTIGNMRISYEKSADHLRQLFGFFGWTQFYPPIYVPLIFCGVAIFIGARIGNRSRRQIISLLLLVIFIVYSPTVLEGLRAASNGWGYQGRYILPVAVGLPFLYFIDGISSEKVNDQKQELNWPIVAVVIAHFLAIIHVAHRFFVGLNGPYFWIGTTQWTGYGGVSLFLTLLGAGALIVVLLVRTQLPTSGAGGVRTSEQGL
jgi:hypothetical protein